MALYVRRATKAGTWYIAEEDVLARNLDGYLEKASQHSAATKRPYPIRAIIGPHAGYSYSGATAAYSYKNVNSDVKRVFLLGPSHYSNIRCCGLSKATACETPFGNIIVDREVVEKLGETDAFAWISREEDEEEHSLELHMPYVAKTLPNAKLVPIMVGSQARASFVSYATLLLPYFLDPSNLFIISSDFCHWGSRFSYTPYDSSSGQEIHEFISTLDHQGMDAIVGMDPDRFSDYLKDTKNTICGRMPITLLLHLIQASGGASKYNLEFVHYEQSSACITKRDSSVSYAAALLYLK